MGSREEASPEAGELADNNRLPVTSEEPRRLTREQISTLIATASLNFSSMVCYSILGPFFPNEAEKKGASSTIIGLIFGCFQLFNFITALIMGKYLVQIGAKFMFVAGMFVSGCITILFGFLDRAPDGPIFIGMCFVVRAMDAVGFSAAMTASFAILVNAFPQNIATVMAALSPNCSAQFSNTGSALGTGYSSIGDISYVPKKNWLFSSLMGR